MRILLTIIFCLTTHMVIGQNSTSSAEDTTQQTDRKISINIVPSYSATKLSGSILSLLGIGINLCYDQKLNTRIYFSHNIDQYSKELIFPTEHVYDQSTIGIDASWLFFDSKIRPLVGAAFSYSKVYWKPLDPEGDQYTDYQWQAAPFLGGDWRISDILRVQARGGYNFSETVELVGFEDGNFNSFFVEALIIIRIVEF